VEDLRRVTRSMAEAAKKAGVPIVTGDTKVVARGAADGLFINTSGIGLIEYPAPLSVKSIEPGDAVLVNGPIGDHGVAILGSRREFGLKSKSSPIPPAQRARRAHPRGDAPDPLHAGRDARGLGAILAEIAERSGCRIVLDEKEIPVRESVRGFCEILGFDPLFLANEGKLTVICAGEDAGKVLAACKATPSARGCRHRPGGEPGRGRLILRTSFGGSRQIDLPWVNLCEGLLMSGTRRRDLPGGDETCRRN